MTVFLYKLDAQMYTYTISTVGQDMESALEVLERMAPKHVSQTSLSGMSLCTTQ